jgi:hypothetical protein
MATISTLYAYNTTVSNANTLLARNTALQALFTDMMGASISGFTYLSSVIPTPTTAY